jgi:signal transduction histidine kinase
LSKIINNALKFTDTGYIHITVQDMSRDVVLPGGYDNSIKLSQVVFDIKDTGRGSEFYVILDTAPS